MNRIANKGFTLIELLVVIAIIGILSSVVLASLNTARTRANVARVQTSMAQVRTLAETLYNGTSYPSASPGLITATATAGCTQVAAADPNLFILATDIRTQNGITDCTTSGAAGQLIIQKTVTTNVDRGYRALARLPGGLITRAYCVDSTGASLEITVDADGVPTAEASGVDPTCANAGD